MFSMAHGEKSTVTTLTRGTLTGTARHEHEHVEGTVRFMQIGKLSMAMDVPVTMRP